MEAVQVILPYWTTQRYIARGGNLTPLSSFNESDVSRIYTRC